MIEFYSEANFKLEDEKRYSEWIEEVIYSEQKTVENITYIFCDDEYLHKINVEYLHHDTLTDIITFDYSVGNALQADVFISEQRVRENALDFNVSFEEELRRVMIHGVLHLCGYKDKTPDESSRMRGKEEEKMKLFHVER